MNKSRIDLARAIVLLLKSLLKR